MSVAILSRAVDGPVRWLPAALHAYDMNPRYTWREGQRELCLDCPARQATSVRGEE
ncbi:hypothetical protein GCM10027079_09310 [Sediminivirga luteola]|uniref:Uncharacterized protein n=1 Tax=Sediminivirga luteola TaxID=1774748 RepID=A0A8J2TYK2_9MICO|nr:hypothetical protein GCM10011333_20370 [Sediminivirga luteola]